MRLILEEQKTWKLREASVQKFLRIIWIKLFVIWQVLKPPLRKLSLGRFFDSTKWLKAYETGYPIFINNFSKPERVVCSKCQNCSSIKMTSLKLAESGQFFFHANDRIPVCEPTTPEIFLMEPITRPCKYELSVRIEVVLNEAIFHQSSS